MNRLKDNEVTMKSDRSAVSSVRVTVQGDMVAEREFQMANICHRDYNWLLIVIRVLNSPSASVCLYVLMCQWAQRSGGERLFKHL